MNDAAHHCPQCGFPVEINNSLCPVCGALYRIDATAVRQVGQTCFACGHQADAAGKNCPECGVEYQIECPSCQAAYSLRVARCPLCGFDPKSEDPDGASPRPERRFGPGTAGIGGTLVRIVLLLCVVGSLFFLVDRLDWNGPQAMGGLVLILAILSLAVVYVIYLPALEKPMRRKKIKSRRDGIFTMVYRTLDLARAEHLTVLLESEGIPAFVYNRHATTLDPFDIFSGIRVMVPRDRLAEVREIMQSFGFDTDDVEDDPEEDGK